MSEDKDDGFKLLPPEGENEIVAINDDQVS